MPTVILLPLMGICDKTLFLSARAEHYGSALVCFLFPGDWLAGAKVVWAAVWSGLAPVTYLKASAGALFEVARRLVG